MPLQVTNTLTKKKEAFVPLRAGQVRMYVCGPTVYGLIHIGNARPFVFFDVVRRYLEYSGYKVTYVKNFTDVDDKIINRAREENVSSREIADRYVQEFLRDMKDLGVRPPDKAPRVTENIPAILALIEGLVKKGFAYVAGDGEVLYSVRKFANYGRLSGKNIDELLAGARVDLAQKKRDPLDFSLWKPQKAPEEPAWDSPWGKGRPGWHIECSAMSMGYLGESFDIHGGGMDLMHPHNENEIAQSEAQTDRPFVKYWLHNNLLTMDNEKMSKSLGNIFLARDFIRKYTAETLKFLLLSGHYRSPIDFSERHIRDSQAALHRFYSTLQKCHAIADVLAINATHSIPEEQKALEAGAQFETRWRESLDDDLNTAKLFGHVFEYVRAVNSAIDRKGFTVTHITKQIALEFQRKMAELSRILNLFGENAALFLTNIRTAVLEERGFSKFDIEEKIKARAEARRQKDFTRADAIRAELLEKGIELRDSSISTEWDVVFAAPAP